jgi:hypothetical protein
VRLLGYWIMFMILLVVFVPAFSLIFSPAYNVIQQCPECECPECPPPPQLYLPRVFPYFMSVTVEDYIMASLSFAVKLRNLSQLGYKYFILVNVHAEYISWAEYCTSEKDEFGFPVCYYMDFRALNRTHSYAFIDSEVYGFLIEIYAWRAGIKVGEIHSIIAVVPAQYTIQDVLRDLQRATIP